ncbi:MAG: hypothetical protein QOF73_4543, partial [Thermomicrobiales bacterium]|nr:hypothetical protein [Thermomicrobiales bacterium]
FLTAAADPDGMRPRIGDRLDVRMVPAGGPWWQGHPDPDVDIAVIDMSRAYRILREQGRQPFVKPLRAEMLPTPRKLEEADAVEDVLIFGYPDGLYDEINLTPLVRKGITATSPTLDYCGKSEVLIDAAVFPGSSGSPVFVWRPADAENPERELPLGMYFLGVLSSGFQMRQEGKIEMVPIPTAVMPIPVTPLLINLGVVHKASKVVETIEYVLRTSPPSPLR